MGWITQDWSVNPQPLNRMVVTVFRANQWARRRTPLRGGRARTALVPLTWLADMVLLRVLVGCELPPQVQVGPSLKLKHAARGVVLGRSVVMGARCTLYHGVTLGARYAEECPTIGDDVVISVDSKVLGEITVGNGAVVGAGAVVLDPVPDGYRAVGCAARLLPPKKR